jgi:2-dehydropantoate 2-reductase
MKIAVLGGGGAMGGLFGAHLAEAGHDVCLIDVSRDAVAAINAHGLTLEDKASGIPRTVSVAASSEPATIGPVDAVLAFVKCYHTEDAVRAALPMLGEQTVVMTLQNGWGNAPRIAAVVGEARVLVGLTYHSATLLAPGRVLHAGKGVTYLGELDGALSPRLEALRQALADAGFEVHVTQQVRDQIYAKLALNACTLPTSALLGLQAHQLIEHDGVLHLMRGLLKEVVAVARAQAITIDEDERWEAITGLLKRAVGAKSSMLQDVERKRRTEIDVINGAIVEAGRRAGIATPYNDSMVWLIKSLEAGF